MNSLIEVIKISKALKTKSSAGRNSLRLKSILCQTLPTREIERKHSYCFLTSIFAFVLLVILQNPSK